MTAALTPIRTAVATLFDHVEKMWSGPPPWWNVEKYVALLELGYLAGHGDESHEDYLLDLASRYDSVLDDDDADAQWFTFGISLGRCRGDVPEAIRLYFSEGVDRDPLEATAEPAAVDGGVGYDVPTLLRYFDIFTPA